MNFFELTYSHMGGRTYPWAAGYGPLPSMPFLGGLTDALKERRLKFWQVNPSPPGMKIDPGGRSWSHMIGCGLGMPEFFVSENLIQDLVECAIPILRATEMPIASISAKALQKIVHPKYFVLEAIPGIEMAWKAMGIPLDRNKKPILVPRPKPFPKAKYCLSSWNGSDLFSPPGGIITTTLFCTERIKILAEEKRWTNVKFLPLEMVDEI
jgi:hypothetical protein